MTRIGRDASESDSESGFSSLGILQIVSSCFGRVMLAEIIFDLKLLYSSLSDCGYRLDFRVNSAESDSESARAPGVCTGSR
jgi:hypothetical protein